MWGQETTFGLALGPSATWSPCLRGRTHWPLLALAVMGQRCWLFGKLGVSIGSMCLTNFLN